MNLLKRKEKFYYYLLFFNMTFLYKIMKILSSSCDYETPISKDGQCSIGKCTKDNFENKICKIDNSLIETQWLNNIINVADSDFLYCNIITMLNGNLFVETSSFPGSYIRIFYGIKKNGRGYFVDKETQEENFHFSMISTLNSRYESTIFSVKLNENKDENEKEFLISMRGGSNFEFYDFENNIIYEEKANTLFGIGYILSFFGTSFKMTTKINYYILGIMGEMYENNSNIKYFFLFKLLFNSKDIKKTNPIVSQTKTHCSGAKILSCFESSSTNIICFYQNTNYKYNQIVYDQNFNILKSLEIAEGSYNEYNFFKVVHFRENIGAFGLYKYNQIKLNNYFFVYLKNYNKDSNEITDYSNSFNCLEINKIDNLDNSTSANDMIKISDSKFCLATYDLNKEKFYLIIVNNYQDDKFKIRYYYINMYNLYLYKFTQELKLSLYNNLIAMTSSYKRENFNINPNTSLIIFSYPNSTDFSIDISRNLQKFLNYVFNPIEKCFIENNLFGYIFYGVKIMNYNEGYELLSRNIGNKLKKDNILIDDQIELVLAKRINFPQNGRIEYSMVLTEPDYNLYDQYSPIIDTTYCNGDGKDEEEIFNANKNYYVGRTSYIDIVIDPNIVTDDCNNDENCAICLKDNLLCITCKYSFKLTDDEKEKICLGNTTNTEYKNCTNNEIIDNKCNEIQIGANQLKEIKNTILNTNYTQNKTNTIIKTKNIIIQLSTLEDQKEQKYIDISNIDLGECENILKDNNGIPRTEQLIIYKTDIRKNDYSTTYVLYEVYNPFDLSKLNVSECLDVPISINVPVKFNDNLQTLYNSLNESGYNIFNENDTFYNDFCAKYTTINGTDILLSDRKKDIYSQSQNQSLCQIGCEFQSYNPKKQKIKCKCQIKKETNEELLDLNIEDLFTKKIMEENYYKTLAYSNFQILKCYKLIFKDIFKNLGEILITIIFIIYIICLIIFSFWDRKKINEYINFILKIRNKDNLKKNEKKCCFKIDKNNNSKKIRKSNITSKNSNKSIKNCKIKEKNNSPPIKKKKTDKNMHNKINDKFEIKSTFSENNSKNILKNNIIFNVNFIKSKTKKNIHIQNNDLIKKNDINIKKMNIYGKKELNNLKKDKDSSKNSLGIKGNELKLKKDIKYRFMNDQELNFLDYEIAIELDKRKFIQYYWSLLKKKQLILFTFIPANDYNLITVKIVIFLISISLNFSINGFFFSDNTMHQIYKNNGAYIIIIQIPKILYSALISSIINIILKTLSLSENKILFLKSIKDMKKALKISKEIKSNLNIKFVIFYILSFLILSFLWYFISCFCAVYYNNQIFLIKDTLISISLSMIYPFGLYLIPSIFRISALRARNRDRQCLYKTSKIISLL